MATREFIAAEKMHLQLMSKVRSSLIAPGLAVVFPFVPPPMMALVGLLFGYIAARNYFHAKHLFDGRRMDPNHEYVTPQDGQFVQGFYLGHAIDFEDFENMQEKWAKENNVTSMDSISRKRYMAYLYESGKLKGQFIPHWMWVRHLAVTGGSGSGKTELYLSLIYQILLKNQGAAIFDAKGSGDLIAKIKKLGEITGRPDDIFYVTFDHAISHTYNPLLYGGTRQTISTVMKMEGETKEEFFRNLNRWALTAAIICLRSQKDTPAFNFADLGVMFNDPYAFHKLFLNIPESKNIERSFVWQFLKQWVTTSRETGEPIYNLDRYRERLTGLANNMFSLTHSEYAHVINDYSPDIELKQAILENKIIVISVGALADKEGLKIFGKLFLADFARAVGEIQKEANRPLNPYTMMCDEYPSIADESHQELWQLVRDANIAMLLSVQGKGFLDVVDPTFTARILTNCASHLYFDTRDPDTREFAAKLAGSVVRSFSQDSEGESSASSQKNFETGALVTENDGFSVSRGSKEMREDLLQPEHFAELEPGDAILLSKFGNYRVRLPIVEFAEVPTDIDEINLPFFEKPKRYGLNLIKHIVKNDAGLIDALSDRS
jgi:intracellular multiplication protein IcmO